MSVIPKDSAETGQVPAAVPIIGQTRRIILRCPDLEGSTPPPDNHDQTLQEPVPTVVDPLSQDRVRAVWDKVISLVGYFDLDPNRALDIILDVLSQHLATHYTFFLTLLSFSPWTGAYLRPFRDKSLDEILTLVETNSLCGRPPNVSGNPRVVAHWQVLGFKFKYYQVRCCHALELERITYSMQTEEVAESVPKNLYLTAAILIRERFIMLEDLYPHVSSLLHFSSRTHICQLYLMKTWRILVKNMSPMFTLVLPGKIPCSRLPLLWNSPHLLLRSPS